MKNVEFELYDSKQLLIDTKVTNDNGIAQFDNLMPGDYIVRESSAPEEFQLAKKDYNITCKMNNKDYNTFSIPIIKKEIANELCSCSVKIQKLGEEFISNQKSYTYNQKPLANVVFGIYQNFDYTILKSNKTIQKGTCVGYLVTNQNGTAEFNDKLPLGNYYIKELQTVHGYEIDSNIYNFELKANQNKEISVILDNQNTFINRLSKAGVQINKTDANTNKPIKNVEFTLYNSKDEQIGVYKTDKKGIIKVDNLPYGDYYFIETKCKNGYYSSNNKYNFKLESPDRIKLNITNTPILKLGFEENYKIILGLIITLIIVMIIGVIAYFAKYRFSENEW